MLNYIAIPELPMPGEVTDSICGGEHYCDICSCYGHCESRLEIIKCKRCGISYVETELYDGICSCCLKAEIDAQKVLKYSEDRSIMQELFESYFDFEINRMSDRIKTALREMILREWSHDRLVREHTCRDKLTAFIAEDDIALGDWASWLNER